jgi:uncharacterized iron-regulated membrane protein
MNQLSKRNRAISTNRIFWFWHFWVGLLLGPLVILVAATGAVYVFKDELETVLYRSLINDPETNWRSADPKDVAKTVAAVLEENPEYRLYGIELETGTSRAPALGLISRSAEPGFRRLYVTSDFRTVRGELTRPNFFSVVLDLHRNLVIGTPGRIFVELATCWLIVSSVMGIYLWWPKNWKKLGGVFIPRLRAKAYVLLRDLHGIVGIAICLFLVLVAVTGLLYSFTWGSAYKAIGAVSGQFEPILNPPGLSEPMDLDPALRSNQAEFAAKGFAMAQSLEKRWKLISVVLPEGKQNSLTIEAGTGYGPYISYAAYHHPIDLSVVATQTVWDTPPMIVWMLWNYPLHVGSFGGSITKWLWLLLSIAAVGLPISGYALMWMRVRSGKPLLPRADRLAPGWIRWGFIASGLLLPMVGISLLLVVLGLSLPVVRRTIMNLN